MARSMIVYSGVKELLWAEAVNTAVHIRNRAISKILGDKTPQEIWTGKVPSISHLRTFGTRVVALDKTQKKKFAPKGRDYIFVGYSLTAKAYRLYDESKNQVIEKRDVKFDEDALEESRQVCITEEDEQLERKESVLMNTEEEDEECDSDDVSATEENEEIVIGPGRPRKLRTGKVGRPRKQYNVINLLKDEDEKIIPQDANEAINGAEGQKWLKAMQDEYTSLINNKTWSLVEPPKGLKPIGNKWVFSIKRDENGNILRYKARLVAKGCSQLYGINYTETFSPVVRHATIRLVLAIAVEYQLHLHQMDVSSAYLNGELNEEVYMRQPEEFVEKSLPNHVLKLKKSLYGLKQSGRAWNEKLDAVLTKIGFKACVSEPCLYINRNEGFSIITVYVDDLIIGSSNINKLNNIKKLISEEFQVVDGGPLHHFLGLEICRPDPTGDIAISQKRYIKNLLHKYHLDECKPVATPLEVNYQTYCNNDNCDNIDTLSYQALIGELTHIAVLTRPDIIHSVSRLAQRNCSPHSEHMTAAKRILRYLNKTIDLKLNFRRTGKPVEGYTDADWGGDTSDRKSYTGYAFKFADAVFAWESRKQAVVALSSTEAEYVALSQAAKEAIYLKKLLKELGIDDSNPIQINSDNLSAQQLVKNPVYHCRSKHIDIKYHHIRDAFKNKEIDLNYIATNELFADILTKNLPKNKHIKFVTEMGLT